MKKHWGKPTPFISQWQLHTHRGHISRLYICWRNMGSHPLSIHSWRLVCWKASTRCPRSLHDFLYTPLPSECSQWATSTTNVIPKSARYNYHAIFHAFPDSIATTARTFVCIEGHYVVLRVLVIGPGQFHALLLVEPNWNQQSQDTLVTKSIWRSDRQSRNTAKLVGYMAYFEEQGWNCLKEQVIQHHAQGISFLITWYDIVRHLEAIYWTWMY